jgi:hypothetical protein
MIAYILLLLISGGFSLAEEASIPTFTSEEDCAKSTRCYCSEDGDYRTRKPKDNPIYVPNDKYGKFCYCTQWDLDHAPKASTFAVYKRKAMRWVKDLFNMQ